MWRGDREVLAGVSLEASAGDCAHVPGPNGSGKTTLLRVIAGLLTPEKGIVAWRGRYRHLYVSVRVGRVDSVSGPQVRLRMLTPDCHIALS